MRTGRLSRKTQEHFPDQQNRLVMLTVRQDQLVHLGKHERAQFKVAMSKVLTDRFPDETARMSVDALIVLVDRGIDLASTYKILLEADVARFLELIVGLGEDFDVQSDFRWIGEILKQTEIEPAARLDMVLERFAFGERGS